MTDDFIIMALGGNSDLASDVEMVDASSEGGICTKPADFPGHKDLAKGAVGAFINKMPTVCGGTEGGRECHGYNFHSQSWLRLPFLMLVERVEAAGITIANGSWIIIAGRTLAGEALATSELLVGDTFNAGPLWPLHFWGHCSVAVNGTHGFIAGGRNEKGFLRASFELEFEARFWNYVVDINYERSGHVCGKVGSANEDVIVVAGGTKLLEVEMVLLSSRKLRIGPMLPHEIDRAATFQTESNFLLIGGLHLGDCPIKLTECFSSKYMYKLDNFTRWNRIQTTMDISRGQHVVIAIPRVEVGLACSRMCPECPGMTGCVFTI